MLRNCEVCPFVYDVCDGISCGVVGNNTTYQICNVQLENAPEDGPLRSETC